MPRRENPFLKMLETKIFKLSPLECASIMLGRYAWQWITIGGVFFISSLFLGIALDIRIFLITLMVLCLLAPVLLAWMYYHYGLYGRSYLNIVRHKISVGHDRFTVIVEVKTTVDSQEEPEYRSFDFPLTALGVFSVYKDKVIYPFDSTEKGFLYIPVSAFDSEIEFRNFIEKLSRPERQDYIA